ncbi:methylmalonyl Co-A mutase-associated GTPase MeaB [Maribacter sp. MMG018]|uniref:methylmalonyl Co-A mutase-associated GTPase MeaB n=1 Tax=Maribacter sp. MMG018 TaxID=2822688 RepID=UPI001B3650E2|nr:methylmalonyl Co-A mutase-associated GTPase MeaB [Maribacter sp. MMG018]MBQ4916276.1 methylmalonyl Co-A mutase-associated GTPase MeaB [Maribacter sp. MMG018]
MGSSDFTDKLVAGILANDTTALGKAITLVESTKHEHQKIAAQIIEACLIQKTDTIRIGITGVPGVGKSTFIENFGKMLTSLDKKVAVLTIDPTSSLSKGSILGDKTRMQELVKDPNAFIRPSPAGDSLGGVAKKTRESIVILEAAGYNVIIVETVGVGQSETAVSNMVDFFLLLKLAGAGDELQGIKRGIMEMADAVAINKADGENMKQVKLAESELKRALHLFPAKENGWATEVTSCSALKNIGLDTIWSIIQKFVNQTKASGHFAASRKQQNKSWLIQHIDHHLKTDFYQNPKIKPLLIEIEEKVVNGHLSPFKAAEELLEIYRNG